MLAVMYSHFECDEPCTTSSTISYSISMLHIMVCKTNSSCTGLVVRANGVGNGGGLGMLLAIRAVPTVQEVEVSEKRGVR